MIILNCNDISLSFGDKKIIENASFSIDESDKVGLVGINGAGKSTLFKIIYGTLHPNSGQAFIAKGKKLGYLQQNTIPDSSNTIWNEMLDAFSNVIEMESQIKEIQQKISIEKDESALTSLMEQYDALNTRFIDMRGYEYNSRAKGILRGLGFDDAQFDLPISALSGGQKTKIALAKLLLNEPDILLLDEPTNHLDITALEWLEEFLKAYTKCVFVISHDRYFLDAVTNKTIELEHGDCILYNGNYSTYIEKKRINNEIHQRHFESQQKEIARMESIIEQYRRWNRQKSIIAAESKQKALDKMEKIDKPKVAPDKLKIALKIDTTSGKDVLSVENLTKAYPGKSLFENISFKVQRGEKVFLLGPNGCGKSTLLKILMDRLDDYSGEFKYATKVKVGYYEQEQETLNENSTIIDEIWNSHEGLTQTEVRNALAAFLFKGDDVFKNISILSGGEKSRVALLKIILSGVNLLILDEPTNHLDIHSREALEQSLLDYEGTILAVSHDRYFINKLATRLLEINNNDLIDYAGDYSSYTKYKKNMLQNNDTEEQNEVSSSKADYENQKLEKAKQKKLERQLSQTEEDIVDIEEQLEDIEKSMADQSITSDHEQLAELFAKQRSLQDRLEKLYELWEELSS